MDKPKHKRQPEVPDQVLARAFGYDAYDLLANRAGWQTRAQLIGLPLRLRPLLPGPLRRWMAGWSSSPVRTETGRIHLLYWQRQTPGFFRFDMQEFHALRLHGEEALYVLSARQHHALHESIVYALYCLPDQPVILSIARAEPGELRRIEEEAPP